MDKFVAEQPAKTTEMAATAQETTQTATDGLVTLRGGCLQLDEYLPCESGDYWYDRCCYCCLGPGSQNP